MTHRREGCDEVCAGSGSDAQLFVCLGVLAETRVCSPKGKLSSLRVHQEVIPIHKEIVNLIFLRWKMLIACASGGTVSRAHGDAKQCKEQ